MRIFSIKKGTTSMRHDTTAKITIGSVSGSGTWKGGMWAQPIRCV
jgi:hypothetical protein